MVVLKMQDSMGEMENDTVRPKVNDAKGILKQSREFLDFFWDIAKPERDVRLKAIENLIENLKSGKQSDELKYTLKRLVAGLGHAREEARSGYSIALAQVLSVFEEIQLKDTLDLIKEHHNLQTAKKKSLRNVLFGNFFGVLALSQSTRLHTEPQVLLECVQLLQRLSLYREHLSGLPRKTMVDILSETSEEVFEELLLGALQRDLTSALSTPEQLELLLVAMQKFPTVLEPKRLKKLLGTAMIITKETIPRLVGVLRTAARSVKKESVLPPVALDLLHMALREDSFELFWGKAIIDGMLKEHPGAMHYLSFRLLGAALPFLSISQLQYVLSGDVMRHYGEHVLSAQLPVRFKFSPEMEKYVVAFFQSCPDPDKQLTVLVAFTQLTNQGYPVVPSFWRVVDHAVPAAMKRYVDWLKDSFCRPQLDEFLDFSTRRQKGNQELGSQNDNCVFRLRKWIIPRLASIVENQNVKKEEDLVMDITRFIFFHAFFNTKKSTPDIPETESSLSVPINEKTQPMIADGFFSLLQHLNHLPALGESPEGTSQQKKRSLGVTADGSMWIYCVVQYAGMLLSQPKYAQCRLPFSPEHRRAWDSMLETVESLRKKAKKSPSPEFAAFEQLFLLVGIQVFKAPDESVELLKDIHSCMEKALAKKSKKKKKSASTGGQEEEEPHWVEVVVEILLSLLSQPSRLVRQVCKTVFSHICPHMTPRALAAILNVLDPNQDEDESGVMVMDEKEGEKKKKQEMEDEELEEEDKDENEEDSDSSEEEEEQDEEERMEEGQEVDQNFRTELMKVLQGQNALATEEDDSDEEEMDDEAMMKLDKSMSALFAEQKKKTQAKKDERERIRKEKTLVRDFKIKVLDLVDLFLSKQASNPLVLDLVEPLLRVIENGMSSDANQQEENFLRKAADIFRNQLCRGKQYSRGVEGRRTELHELLERLMARAQKHGDSSVSLYFFSAALYVVKVLRGVQGTTSEAKEEMESEESAGAAEERLMGNADVERVTTCFHNALKSFMTHRQSPLTGAMFLDLFNRFPVLCVRLLDTTVVNITEGVREHQQAQACTMVLRALQSREVQQLLTTPQRTQLAQETVHQITKSLQNVENQNKAVHEKIIKALELLQFLLKHIHQQKMDIDVKSLKNVLESMNQDGSLQKAGQLEDTYWSVMKHFGVQKPKMEKVKKSEKEEPEGEEEDTEQAALKKKKKGFLPETKRRKNRKKPPVLEGKEAAAAAASVKPVAKETAGEGGEQGATKKKKKKNKKRKQQGGDETEAQTPQKKAKMQPLGKKKKAKKEATA